MLYACMYMVILLYIIWRIAAVKSKYRTYSAYYIHTTYIHTYRRIIISVFSPSASYMLASCTLQYSTVVCCTTTYIPSIQSILSIPPCSRVQELRLCDYELCDNGAREGREGAQYRIA